GQQAPSSRARPDHGATDPASPPADARDMVSRRPRPRRMLLPIILAGILAAEITGLAIARSIVPTLPVEGPAAPMSPSVATLGRLHDDIDRIASAAAHRNAPDPGRDP